MVRKILNNIKTMNKKYIFNISVLAIAVTVVFSSCLNDKRFFVDAETFKLQDLETYKLKGSIMQFNDTIWHPVDITVKDTLLFIKNRSTDFIYDIYNLNNNQKINECFRIGQGPNDFIFPLIVQSMDTNVWIYDREIVKVKEYTVSSLLESKFPISIKTISLRNKASDKIAVLSDGTVLASINSLPRGGFDFYDSAGFFLDSIGGFPEFTSGKMSDMEKVMSLRYGFTSNMTDRIFMA
jgi:hypothetical protein